ncbi:MAG: heptosyltransferase I [Motiliproteus sp.]
MISIDSVLARPPRSICVLRLSALGDVCNTLPTVRAIQRQWPDCRITWIVGKAEGLMLEGIDGIDLQVYDKSSGIKGALALRRRLAGERFDILLHMQSALRASLLSLFIPADIKLGFDAGRAKDHQTWFTTHQIRPNPKAHMLETYLDFARALGVATDRLEWRLPIPEAAQAHARELSGQQPYLLISPCANPRIRNFRNWSAEGYAALIDYARQQHGLNCILSGGNSAIEQEIGSQIQHLCQPPPLNLIGKTPLKTLLALIDQARLVVGPDSGPMHMAAATGTPAIGLYASTNPDRARCYSSPDWVVNRFPDQVRRTLNKDARELPWTTRVRTPNVMSIITTAEVKAMLDKLLADTHV